MMINNENVVPNKTTSAKGKGGKSIEEMYTKMTQLEHILLRPDTYVGSIEKQTQQMWVLDKFSKQIELKTCTFVPGLFKIFDEIIVNAADNKQRDKNMNKLDVTINVEEGFVRVWNNGQGIPIVIHQEHKIYVPELIFGNLLTGSNFNDEEEKTTGGRNGYGAKLANIFSTRFIVETADSSRQLTYKQEFSKNMGCRSDPQITKYGGSDFTCITFYPDLKRFKMDSLDEDIVGLLSKRVYDIAGTNTAAGAKLNVFLNGERVEAKTFEQYVSLYKGLEPPVAFEKVNERWEIGVGVSDGTFQQVSFVNSISTTKGGCHVNYITDQVTSKLMGVVKKKNKGEEVKAGQIKNHLAIYVNCLIVNPAFDSQTKENLTTKASAFGSTCQVSDKLMKLVEKSGVVDNILNWAKFKQTNDLKKKSGSKRSTIQGITKLDDANCAGTSKSSQCTLILTEGDSAKALAISGLGVVGRDYYGVFPLKGKLLNVREANHSILMKNEEVQNIVKILGLTFGKVYEDVSSLRYGHLMIMADQDHDGSHIKGLLINFLHHFWPSLLKIKGFMQQFITPIVKCSKGKKQETFFTIPEYHQWRETHDEGRGWDIKYYKGLGTSTSAEAKEYFSNLQTHEVTFKWDERADDMIDMAFAKKRVEDRKLWLLSMEKGVHMDYTAGNVTYDDFVNHELILFSHADNQRSIPHYMDGFKPSQRKVLFSCFKRNLKQEIKVAQLAGYVSEHSAYHHGEASLNMTIIGMAQNFVGSNNINLLCPNGQFGTRLMGGKDAASPRYVFTKLQKITRHIFHPSDDPLLEYLDDDGQSIEPTYYVPVIPMVLVNGSEGIGTGWSTSIPTYNPRDIIDSLRSMINGADATELIPWFRGFTGEIQSKSGRDSHNFVVSGTIEQINDTTVVISELPVGKWTTDYKQFLESVLIGGPGATATKDKEKEGESGPAPCAPFVKEFKENHTDTTVLFTVTCPAEKLVEFANEKGGLAKKFKLDGSCATSNMHMFDLSSQIQKFDGPMEVMREFYKIRLMYYDKRKLHLTQKLTEEWDRLNNKMNFILAVISGKLVVANRKKADILVDLKMQGFRAFVDRKAGEEGDEVAEDSASGYDYLLSMKIWSLTVERVNDLKSQRDAKRKELEILAAKTAESLWLEDLDALEAALDDFEADIEVEKRQELAARRKASKDKANKKGGKKSSKKYNSDDDSEMEEDEEEYDSEYERAKRAKANAAAAAKRKAAAEALTAAKLAQATAAASAPVVVKDAVSAPAVVKQVQPKITKAFQREEILPDREVMSLADRLKATALNNNKSAPSVVSSAAVAAAAPTTKATKPKAAPKATKKKAAAKSDSEDDIFDRDEDDGEGLEDTPPAAARPARAVRAAAVVKKLYTLDSDLSDGEDCSESEEESDAEEDEEEEASDDDDFDDFDSDDYSEKKGKKKAGTSGKGKSTVTAAPKAAVKSAAPAVKASAKAVPAAAAAAAAAVVSAAPIKTTPIKKMPSMTGVKRGAKSAGTSSSSSAVAAAAMEMFSPEKESPKVVKKAKSVTATAAPKAPKAKAAPAAKKTASTAPKKTAAPRKKKSSYDSDEAEFDDDEEEGAPLAMMKSPKPVRARKATNFKAMYEEDSMDDFIASEDEESEFDE